MKYTYEKASNQEPCNGYGEIVLKDNVIYGIADEHIMLFKCPCQCGDIMNIPVNFKDGSQWAMTLDAGITLSPSLHRTTGCRSHFFIKKGEVVWA